MPLFDALKPSIPSIMYIISWTLLFLSGLWAVEGQSFRYEPLVTALTALVASMLLLNELLNVNRPLIDYALSGLVIAFALAMFVIAMYRAYKRDKAYKCIKDWRIWVILTLFTLYAVVSIAFFWIYYSKDMRSVTNKVVLTTESTARTSDARRSAEWEQSAANVFTEQTGAQVVIIPADPDPNVRHETYRKYFETAPREDWRRDPTNDLDVLAIDVIWPEVYAQHAEDLTPFFGDLRQDFIPALVDNNTVNDIVIYISRYNMTQSLRIEQSTS